VEGEIINDGKVSGYGINGKSAEGENCQMRN
jgi:hypothetical protein